MPTIDVYLDDILTHANQPVGLAQVAQAGALELSITAPSLLHLGPFISELLDTAHPQPAPMRWLGSGPGVGIEMRRTMSAISGRFMARWYAVCHLNIPTAIPISKEPFFLPATGGVEFEVARQAGNGGDLPDWVWAKVIGRQHEVGFLEAKANYYPRNRLRSMQGAMQQLGRLTIRDVNSPPNVFMRQKGWAVGTCWACSAQINRGFATPRLDVWDPPQGEQEWSDRQARAVLAGMLRYQTALSLNGLGALLNAGAIAQGVLAESLWARPTAARETGRWRVSGTADGATDIIGSSVTGSISAIDGFVIGYREDFLERLRGMNEENAAVESARECLPVVVRRDLAERLGDENRQSF